MPSNTTSEEPGRWEQSVREAAQKAEDELRRVVTYLNDEVVPDIRRNSSRALFAAAAELEKLAKSMEDHAVGGGTPKP